MNGWLKKFVAFFPYIRVSSCLIPDPERETKGPSLFSIAMKGMVIFNNKKID